MSLRARVSARRRAKPAPPGEGDTRRRFVTPEGVDLRLQIGSYVDRLMALMIDGLIIVGALVALTVLALLTHFKTRSQASQEAITIIWLVGSFLLRVGYFVGFEIRAGGATPGKRVMGLRVIARDGRRLTADAIFARNAMRELEVFLPIIFLLARGYGVDAGLITLGVLWTGVFMLFPLFNRDRLRLGDIAAGTMVVKAPMMRLLPDIADSAPDTVEGIAFSAAQLDVYGIKELQVLEQVLRTGDRRTMAAVARRIRGKIGWDGAGDVPDRSFLNAYYAALRQRLETGLLFGVRRRDKHDLGDQANT